MGGSIMTLTSKQKQWLHTGLITFGTGVGTALLEAFRTPGSFSTTKALVATLGGLLIGGFSRLVGSWLAKAPTAP